MSKDNKLTWRKKVRLKLAEAFGGKCAICGYDKCISALDYHHINPKEKDKLLSSAMRDGASWDKIVEEARKCTIICCRCHRELHSGITKLPKNIPRFNEEYASLTKEKEFDDCPMCGTLKLKNHKFCSPKCSSQSQEKFNIDKEELEKLIKSNSYEEIGRKYGVSGNAIKKRALRFNIALEKRKS